MRTEEETDVRAAIAQIPVLAGHKHAVVRLGGLTNRVYRVGEHVLRIPGAGTEEYINRGNEIAAARIAADAGVAPGLAYADAKNGLMVTALIAGAETLSPELFQKRQGAVARAGRALNRLHRCGGVFPFRFELFAMIDEYLKVLATKTVALPEGYHDVVAEAQGLRKVLARSAVPLAPCHCDPLCENFLDTGDRVWIVDWEYSGMNDPMWDLGDLSVEGQFSEAQDEALLVAYFGAAPAKGEHGRMTIYKAMCDLLWTLWGLIQLANNNPADDFRAYADGRFARCKALMATPDFARHVGNVS